MGFFSEEFLSWLDQHADEIDKKSCQAGEELIEKIAAEGAFRVGVPKVLGGLGGNDQDVIDILAELAQHSLTASFISWGQRTLIDNILHTDNAYFKEVYLEKLLSGEYAGATALSNAVKYPNARRDRFLTIFVAGFADDPSQSYVVAVPSDAENFSRSEDLEFVSLQGGNTAALTFNKVSLKEEWILSRDAHQFLAQNRPAFLGYQFGLAFGLAERSLSEVEKELGKRGILKEEWQHQVEQLDDIRHSLYQGLSEESYFVRNPRELFQLRIDIVDVVAQSLLLELQAGGGRGYFSKSTSGFIRRWNEGAFLPIVSPSAVQLRHILATN